jgi:hypothetical protein
MVIHPVNLTDFKDKVLEPRGKLSNLLDTRSILFKYYQ